eukprot:TRINITY_DN7666_c0_g1_i1.p1 TRINITY_DN7666_c0_g1~~TRINITY_DN7666_c0_g1_i1.p1  ORF type:complete len:1052 (-),score=174.44 TRINITY_DN7666_c0_g1_i1:55-3210(-)
MKQVLPGFTPRRSKDGTAAISSPGKADKSFRASVVRPKASIVRQLLPIYNKPAISEKLAFAGMAHIPNSLDRPMSFAQRRGQKMLQEHQELDVENEALEGSHSLLPTSVSTSRRTKPVNLSRLVNSRRRLGGECCARRGGTCHAPDPYTMSPDSLDNMIVIKEKIDDKSEVQSRSAWLSPASSTSSSRKSTAIAHTDLSRTKLLKKVTASHIPMPPNSPPEHSPRRRRLAQQAVQSSLSRTGKETEPAEQTDTARPLAETTLGEANALGEDSLRGSFFKKRGTSVRASISVSKMADQALAVMTDKNDSFSMARANLARMSVAPDSMEQKADELGIAQMHKIARSRIRRLQDRLKEKREESLLQRRYANLPHEEKEFLEKVFVRFDADCSGTLDWDEVTACLRELGLAGTNTLEKREVLKVCRDALMTAQAQQVEVMVQRQMSAQARLRQHRQGRFARNVPVVTVAKAFIPKRASDEERRKAKVSEESRNTRTLNQDRSVPGKATLPRTRSTFSEHRGSDSQDEEEETSSRNSSKQASFSVHESDSESDGVRSGSEEHNADVEDDIDFTSHTVSFDFFTFAVLVVPRVRQRLRELQSSKVLRFFCHFDRDGSGTLSVPKCEEIGRCLGLDARIFSQAVDANKSKKDDSLDFAAFEKSVMTARELAERHLRSREHAILDETGIPSELFDDFRNIIVQVYEAFKALSIFDDHAGERRITGTSAFNSLRELGLMSRSNWEQEHLQALLAEGTREDEFGADSDAESTSSHLVANPELTFEQYMLYLQRVRSFHKSRQVHELRRIFDRFDKDRSGTLSLAEVSIFLESLDMLPRSRREQEELGQLIQSVDEDGNGCLDFVEFQELVHRIEEKFASLRYEVELEYALSNGFDEGQVNEFRWMFEIIDEDGSGCLDSREVRKGLNRMKKPVGSDVFEEAWKKLDADGSGSLDFCEFIDLMKMLRDRVGMFSDDSAKLPSQMCLFDDRVLRMLLGHLKYSSAHLRCLEKKDLVDLACASFNITGNENLCEKLRVHSLAELVEYAKSQGEKDIAHHTPGVR